MKPAFEVNNEYDRTPPSIALQLAWQTTTPKGNLLITPKMNTNEEIDYTIDKLIEELNFLRKKSKKELLRREHKKTIV